MLCYSKISKMKYFLDPPPPKKRLKDTNGPDMSRRRSVCLYIQPVTWISNPFIEKYYLIIVVFSCPHFSIYDIFYTLENTRSFNARATHFNEPRTCGVQIHYAICRRSKLHLFLIKHKFSIQCPPGNVWNCMCHKRYWDLMKAEQGEHLVLDS